MNKVALALIVVILLLVAAASKRLVFDGLVTDDAVMSSSGRSADQERYLKAAKFASALASLTSLKPLLAMYFSEHGYWPANLTDMGLFGDELSGEGFIDAISIHRGSLYASIESEFAAGAAIRLTPSVSEGGMTINWVCETNVIVTQVNSCFYNDTLLFP